MNKFASKFKKSGNIKFPHFHLKPQMPTGMVCYPRSDLMQINSKSIRPFALGNWHIDLSDHCLGICFPFEIAGGCRGLF